MILNIKHRLIFNFEVYNVQNGSELLYTKYNFDKITKWCLKNLNIRSYNLRCVEDAIIVEFINYDNAVLFELTWG